MWTCSHGNSKGQEQDQAQLREFFSFANILLAKSSHMPVRMETQTKFLRKECRHRGVKSVKQSDYYTRCRYCLHGIFTYVTLFLQNLKGILTVSEQFKAVFLKFYCNLL